MLLGDLLAQRDTPAPVEAVPEPQLRIQPVAVPASGDVGRREARQRLAELEGAAITNLRSAEEARTVLQAEHARLQHECSARMRAETEVGSLRRELDRLRDAEEQRAAQAKARALRIAREEVTSEIQRFHEEHDKTIAELERVRGSLDDHNGLLSEYAQRLREEQQARAAMKIKLDEAEKTRQYMEQTLEHATQTARQRTEDTLMQLADAEAQLADARAERDRLAAKVEELSAGEELAHLHETVSQLATRAEAAEGELVRARADGDRLRAHAAALGDELASLRATVVELQAAAPAPLVAPSAAASEDAATEAEDPARPPLARRRPKRGSEAPPLPVRRTAMAELNALASANPADDLTPRRR